MLYICGMSVKKTMTELGRISTEEFKRAKKLPAILVLDDVRSMQNVGSVFRTADSFLLEAIYLCGYTPQTSTSRYTKNSLRCY
jgi:23S rRNA (guanosine2251-2'-O)-methyltransferase